MLKQTFSLAIMATLLSGCAITADQTQQRTQSNIPAVDLISLDNKLTDNNQQLLNEFKQTNAQQRQSFTDLKAQLSALQKSIKDSAQTKQQVKIVEIPKICPETLGDKFLLGQVEYIYVDELKASFNTRIDTGAESSSLDARNIVPFERDGHQWVRFDVQTKAGKSSMRTFESRVERFVRIKQDPQGADDRRPVIRAHLQIGKYAAETDLNLTDRSHLEYPLLLGRKFMKDIAVVDVGKSYVHGKPQPHTTHRKIKEK